MESPPFEHLRPPHANFPIIAVAIIGILATAFLLVSYYIFVIKCCLNWHRIDLLRRFSISRRRRVDEPLMVYPAAVDNRGLDEAAIRSIPIFQFKKNEESDGECSVCLNEFREKEKLKIIPNCGHVFHIDCIDIWLQNNANCPLCRTSISPAEIKFQIPDQIPSSQDPNYNHEDSFTGREEDYVVIELGFDGDGSSSLQTRANFNFNSGEFLSFTPSPRKPEPKIVKKKAGKLSHISSMGDEYIDSRKKDEQFAVQPIRRSFSMDSADDRQLYSAVQEIILLQEGGLVNGEAISLLEGCSSSRVKRSFFSFGHGRSSRMQFRFNHLH